MPAVSPVTQLFFGRFPDYDIALIVLSNRSSFDGASLARTIIHHMLELPSPQRQPLPLMPDTFRTMAGTYRSVFGKVQVRAEDHTLLYLSGEATHVLVPMSATSFYWFEDEDIEVHFENQNEQGVYERIRVIWPFFWLTAERVAS